VVATTQLIADGVREIGGDAVQVSAMMGEGVDPHLYKASPGDVRLLSEAELVLYNGLHLEGKMAEVLARLGRKKPTVAVAEAIPKEKLIVVGGSGEEQVHDPHVWFDISLWQVAVAEMKRALIAARPQHSARFEERAATYLATLTELDSWVRSTLERIPPTRRVLITAHDAFEYFARAYRLEVHGIQGLSTESEASLKEMNGLVELLVSRAIPAVFVESSVPPKTVHALVEGAQARGHTVTIGGELFSDSMGRPGTPEGTYLGVVRHNVNTIVQGLQER
jgi:manganese/zinc/iron transport system substrate-binding protein